MTYALLAALAAVIVGRLARYMAYLRRTPARGLHDWSVYSRGWGAFEFRARVRCRRCRVTRPEDDVGRLPPDCESTRDFLVVEDVMES